MREIVFKNAQGVNDKRSVFVYDGFSRKAIGREYTWNTGTSAWTQVSETRSVHDGMEVVQERDASNVIQTKYVRDGNIGGLLSKSTSTDSFFYHYDGSGNVVQMSDGAKAVVAEYRYDAFGNTLSATGTQATANPYRFSTKYFHAASGLYDYGYRFYSPGLGRWINRDPIEEAGGLNLYGFAANSPVNAVDEYGEQVLFGAMPPWVGPTVGLGGRMPLRFPFNPRNFRPPGLQRVKGDNGKCSWRQFRGLDKKGKPTYGPKRYEYHRGHPHDDPALPRNPARENPHYHKWDQHGPANKDIHKVPDSTGDTHIPPGSPVFGFPPIDPTDSSCGDNPCGELSQNNLA